MPRYEADRRSIPYEPQPEAVRTVEILGPILQEMHLGLARALRKIDSTAAYLAPRCASIRQFGARHGLAPSFADTLRYVGWAMEVFDWVEKGLRDGWFTMDEAEWLGRLALVHVHVEKGALEEGDDWKHSARFEGLRVLKRKVRERIECVRQRRSELVPFQTHLTPEAWADYLKAQKIASDKAGRKLTRGQATAAILRDYVHRHDPDEKGEGKRRIGDTSSPSCRTIPAATIRACRKKYGDRCWVPGCDEDVCLEYMHVTPNAEGGSQEPDNIGPGCHRHHVMFDAGEIWIAGWSDEGLPIFETKDGFLLHPDYPHRPLRVGAELVSARGSSAVGTEPNGPRDATQGPRRAKPPPDRVSEGSCGDRRVRPWRLDGWLTGSERAARPPRSRSERPPRVAQARARVGSASGARRTGPRSISRGPPG